LNTRSNSRRNPQGSNKLNRELEVGQADEVIMNENESEDEAQDNESHGSHEQDNHDNN